MKFIDLYAGIGGFRTALESNGMECVFTSEIDKHPRNIYSILYGVDDNDIAGDITKVKHEDVDRHDLLVGGFPCQSFSINGKRKGFQGVTGSLFFEGARIARDKQPKFILMENVTGLLSHNKTETISVMMQTLNEAGYAVDFQVLTSTEFGLPQKRERVFIVGSRDVKYEEWKMESHKKQVNNTKAKVLSYFPELRTFNHEFPEINKVKMKWFKDIAEKDAKDVKYIDLGDGLVDLGDNKYRIKDGTIKGYTEFEAKPYTTTIDYTFMTSKTRRGRVKQGITKTLDQSVDVAVFDGVGFRRITPLEVFRLQGFPDEYYHKLVEHGVEKTQLYKRPSRSVSIPIVKALGESILELDKKLYGGD